MTTNNPWTNYNIEIRATYFFNKFWNFFWVMLIVTVDMDNVLIITHQSGLETGYETNSLPKVDRMADNVCTGSNWYLSCVISGTIINNKYIIIFRDILQDFPNNFSFIIGLCYHGNFHMVRYSSDKAEKKKLVLN